MTTPSEHYREAVRLLAIHQEESDHLSLDYYNNEPGYVERTRADQADRLALAQVHATLANVSDLTARRADPEY